MALVKGPIVLTGKGMAMFVVAAVGISPGTAPARRDVWPSGEWAQVRPEQTGMDPGKLAKARDYALTGGGSGMIVRAGRCVLAWGPQGKRYDLKSTTKSFGATALALALADGKVAGLQDRAGKYHPSLGIPPASNAQTGLIDRITLFHLATHTAGFEKPGGYGRLLFAPGTKWLYSDAGPNWLAECLTLLYRRDLKDVMFERVFTPIGITDKDLTWRPNAYRPRQIEGIPRREFGSGIHANVNAMVRLGYLYLRGGRWRDKQILPKSFVEAAGGTPEAIRGLPVLGEIGSKPRASDHYGLLWWNNADGALRGVPRDAYWSWGLHDSFIVVVPSLDLVAARAGRSWDRNGQTDYEALGRFLRPIVAAVKDTSAVTTTQRGGAPYPPSPVIAKLTWAPTESIVRKGEGSDNWPTTWGDDDALYTAYGDGWGFVPKVPGKLSLGLAKVLGSPPQFSGVNIRSATGEQVGDGQRGRKASGILMVDGVLYMWVRNAARTGTQSQLAVSTDHAKTWTWADWRFAALGYCTFVQFGRNYAGARDEYVYAVSHDGPSAYEPGDRFVLMRVPKGKIAERKAYEFFAGRNSAGQPRWSRRIGDRAGVFQHKRRCMRSGVSYCRTLKRYLWWQGIPGGPTRFKGGFGVYDAPEPWGPWTTVYFTEMWDVGPGETAHFPPKWMSPDGRSAYLVFSGEDYFSVRKATLTVAP